MVAVNHRFVVTLSNNRLCNWAEVTSSANDFLRVEGELLSLSSANSHHNGTGVTRISTSFAGVFTTISIVKQNASNVATLDNRTASFTNHALASAEQKRIELSAGQGIASLEAFDRFLRQWDTDRISAWG